MGIYRKSKSIFEKLKNDVSTYIVNLYTCVKLYSVNLYQRIKSYFINLYQRVKTYNLAIRKNIPVWVSKYWQYYYRFNILLVGVRGKYRGLFIIGFLLVLFVCSWVFYQNISNIIEPYFSGKERLDDLQTLYVSLGGALIGATAIAFSLIMFAMQVNVERMPHGLFKKFSSDLKLLGAFGVTFALAIIIIALSLIPDKSWVTLSVLGTVWCVILMILFLLIAYRRALNLISPTKQLMFLHDDTKKSLDKWCKAAKRAAPLLKSRTNDINQVNISEHDIERNTYFQLYPQWSSEAFTSVSHCISFSRRFSEQGDHEVSGFALNTVIAINAEYIKAKGKTFFSNNYLIDNPMASDGFINDTLECLRQNILIGLSREDEQFIEQSLKTLLGLCQLYSNIDYATDQAVKSHTHLAASYLSASVESIVPHNMPDVLMEGIRLMGSAAQLLLSIKEPEHIVSITEKIALISCAGSINEKYRPVTEIGVQQLANLTFELLRCESDNIQHTVREIRNGIKLIAQMYLKTTDTPLMSVHSATLATYYSGTRTSSFQINLPILVNAVLEADQENEDAKRVIHHLEQWSDGLYQIEEELLLLAIEKKSFLAFDIIHHIKNAVGILCAASNAPACNENNRDELRRNALWLLSVLSCIPDEREITSFIENFQLTEIIFEIAIDAHQRDCDELFQRTTEILLSWAFTAGKYRIGWAILERACYGLACLNIINGLDDNVLLSKIEEKVSQVDAPILELRFRASEHIREKADEHRNGGYAIRKIEAMMAQVDQGGLRTILIGIADKLIPEELEQ